MSEEIRLFLNGIANSLNINGYSNIVTSSKKMGEITTKVNTKREKNQSRLNKVVNAKLSEYTA